MVYMYVIGWWAPDRAHSSRISRYQSSEILCSSAALRASHQTQEGTTDGKAWNKQMLGEKSNHFRLAPNLPYLWSIGNEPGSDDLLHSADTGNLKWSRFWVISWNISTGWECFQPLTSQLADSTPLDRFTHQLSSSMPPPQPLLSEQAAFGKHLFTQGYPLWNPDPDLLPQAHQRVGLRIGDVGTVDERGRFDVFFNILESTPESAYFPTNLRPIEDDARCGGSDILPREVVSSPETPWDVDQVEMLTVGGVTYADFLP